jgi:16S rRNA processing protein RimM
MAADEWIILAHLLRPQGRRGELLAEVLTDFPERFSRTAPVTLLPPDGVASPTNGATSKISRQANLIAHWFPVGRNAGRVVLQFADVDSINAAEDLAGWSVALPLSERMPLTDGAVYLSDLIGCTLYDGETALGIVDNVEFPAPTAAAESSTPDAPALLNVKINGNACLIPFVKAWLVHVDTANKRIEMRLPADLLEINQP